MAELIDRMGGAATAYSASGGGYDEQSSPAGRIQGACCAMIFGCLGFPASLYLLGNNEYHFVKERKSIIYADANTVEIPCSTLNTAVTPDQRNGVYFSCPFDQASIEQKIWKPSSFGDNDNSGNVSLDSAIAFYGVTVQQEVDIAVCLETEHKQTERSSYFEYSIAWHEGIPSTTFSTLPEAVVARNAACGTGPRAKCPRNLGDCSYALRSLDAVQAGTFQITESLLKKRVPADGVVSLVSFAPKFVGVATLYSGTVGVTTPATAVLTGDVDVDVTNSAIVNNEIVTCNPAAPPAIGCVKIRYKTNTATWGSYIGRVAPDGRTIEMDVPSSWMMAADTYWNARSGLAAMAKEDFIKALNDENQMETWITRAIGLLLVWLSVICILQPISAGIDLMTDCLDWIPCVGGCLNNYIDGLVSWVICMFSLVCGCSCGLFVIAVTWVVLRPMVGGVMLAGCVLLCCCGGCLLMANKPNPRNKKQRLYDQESGSSSEDDHRPYGH